MLGGAYSQYKTEERQHIDTIKTLAENEKSDSIARAKKLSVETNRRRRALAIKRKSEAEREEKRRQQILAKRREKQKEATEKFQRGHLPSRPDSGSSGRWSPRRNVTHTALEDALKLVRGSPTGTRASSARTRNQSSPHASFYRQNSDPLSKPYFNKYAHPSINGTSVVHNGNTSPQKQEELHNKSLRNLHNSRNLFEQQLETYQQTLLEQQQKTLKEFNKQIMKELEVDKNVINDDVNEVNELESSESLSSVDSLEDEGSNDTLRDSCDLNTFMAQKHENGVNGTVGNSKNVTFAGDHKEAVKIYENNSYVLQNGNSSGPQNIDSYSAQIQALQNTDKKADDQKQQFYAQRQREIQQQLQEQQQQQQHMLLQQKQQKDLQQKLLEQQQKQQQLLQQKQQKELQQKVLEQQQQQQLLLQQKQQKDLQQKLLEQQQKQQQLLQQQYERQKQEEYEKQQQQLKLQQQQQQQQQFAATVIENYSNLDETERPKVQNKAWATPSPHPPIPASTVISTAQTYVTHASPYSGKNTHTNMTVPLVSPHGFGSNSSTPVSTQHDFQDPSVNIHANVTKTVPGNSNVTKAENQSLTRSAQEKGFSFLETVTNGLPVSQNSNASDLRVSSAPVSRNTPGTISTPASSTQTRDTHQTSKTTENNAAPSKVTTTATTAATHKPPIHPGYYNSYGAAFSARQQLTSGPSPSNKLAETPVTIPTAVDPKKTNGAVTWELPPGLMAGNLAMMTADSALNGEDIADTDSVSTICEDKESEPKEVKGILKRNGSVKKTGGILKKAGSTGNMKEIRDSLEITRVHLQTSAEEKEQRMLREKELLNNPAPVPTKKNVRFADLCYEEDLEQNEEPVDDRLFVKRNDSTSQKPSRPVSAITAKMFNPKIDSKPPRATSAAARTSTIPHAKTQIVRPTAAAHIITQSTQNIDATFDNKVTIVNSNFMEKVPAMARGNQTVLSIAPASVYNVNSVGYTQSPQKVNYAVSSIVMPKGESAPFVYPGYNKQGPSPSGSANGPSQAGSSSKYDGAVYDDNGLRIDRTPTDDEINFLWDKLRTCLSRNSNAPSDPGQHDGQMVGSRQAAPLAHTYIDGNALGQFNSLNRVAHQPNPSLHRQNSLDSANSSYARRYGLLQQRKQQPNPNSLKSRQQQASPQQGYTVYQAPVQSHTEPQPSGFIHNGAEVSESMAGFLAAEQLAEQSVSESRIHQAIDDAQSRQMAFNATRPQPKVKSALSVEEQRLMESLDRLNDKLKVTENTIPGEHTTIQSVQVPVQQQRQQHVIHDYNYTEDEDDLVAGFKGHSPISQRRVIEAGNHRARLRITSANLKRNLHRHQ